MGSGGLIRALMAVNTGTKEGEMDRAQREATLAQYAEQRAVEQAQLEKTQQETAALPKNWDQAKERYTLPAQLREQGQEVSAGDRLSGTKDTNQTKVKTTGMNNDTSESNAQLKADTDKAIADERIREMGLKFNEGIDQRAGQSFVTQTSALAKRGQAYRNLINAMDQSPNNPAAYKPMLLNAMQYMDANSSMRIGLAKMGMTPDQSAAGQIDQWLQRMTTGKPPAQLTAQLRQLAEADRQSDLSTYADAREGLLKGNPGAGRFIMTTDGMVGYKPSLSPPPTPAAAAPSGGLTAPRPGSVAGATPPSPNGVVGGKKSISPELFQTLQKQNPGVQLDQYYEVAPTPPAAVAPPGAPQ